VSIGRRDSVRRRLLFAGALLVAFILAVPSGAAAHPVSIEADRGSRELIVRFAPQAEFNATARKIAHVRAGTARVRGLHGMLGHDLVSVPKGSSVAEVMRRYRMDPSVLYVEPNYPVSVATVPSDPLFAEQWALENTGQSGGKAGADIGAPAAWTMSTGSPDALVAVIDTGVDYHHPDLTPNMWSGLGWNFVEDNDDPMDIHGHGTHVAGTIAAVADDGFGMAGVAWEARVMALKALSNSGSGWTSDIAEAVTFASDNGADIINMSLVGGSYSQALYDAIAASDALVVCAAGNSGSNNDSSPQYPASYDLDNIVSVAATDSADKLASFSNYGAESVDVGAPGVAILSTVPGATYSATAVFSDPLDTLHAWDTSDFDSSPWTLSSEYYVSPSYSAAHAPAGGYAAYEQSWIATRDYISLTDADRVTISFNAALDTVSADDWLLVAAEVEGGHWQALGYVSGSTGGKFNSYKAEFSQLAGSRARLAFIFLGGEIGGGKGVWVDDVKVYSVTRDGGADYSGAHGYKSGTSMAAPHVAGAAALLKSYVPDLDAGEMKEAILSSAEQIGTLSGKTLTGGRLDAAGMLASVKPANDAPVANDIAYAVEAGSELLVAAPGVLANDTDSDDDELWSILEADVSHGTLALSTDGSFTYTPEEGFTGTDSFTYRAHDGTDYSDVANVTITVTPPVRTLTYTSGGGGTIDGATPQYITHGGAGTAVTALADYGYHFVQWSDGSTANPRTDTDVTADVTVTAVFALKTYTLTYTAGEGGSIVGTTPQTVEHGGSGSEVWAQALPHYDFVGWSDGVMTPNRTDTDVTADISVQANFVKRTYTITATAGEGGSIDPSGAVVVDWMTTQAFWVTPDAGYEVDTVTVDGQPSALTDPVANTYTFVNVTADHTIHVTFAPEPPPASIPIEGLSRFHTAVAASVEAYPDGSDYVIIATGRNWPDALGGTALAGALDAPILLSEPTSLPSVTADEISRLGATHAIILGGTGAVSSGVQTTLATTMGLSVERIDGLTRYQTADKIALRVIELQPGYGGTAFVATGGDFPDALAAAPLAAANGWPLFLAHPTTGLSDATKAAMTGVTRVRVLGGTGALSPATYSYLSTRFGAGNVARLAGDTRYSTAVAIASWGVSDAGLGWDRVGIATGQDYPDALAGGVLQGKVGSVMLLTLPTSLHPATATALTANAGAIHTVTFFGGTGAVSTAVSTAALAAAGIVP
jgi:VCBS repeat-containing protein